MKRLMHAIAAYTAMKEDCLRKVADCNQQLQQKARFEGSNKVHLPSKDGDLADPPEERIVQSRFGEVLDTAKKTWIALMNGSYQVDEGNTRAKADIIVDGHTLAKDVPTATLLFLKKQWKDVHTFLTNLPVPGASTRWEYDANTDLLRSEKPVVTHKTKKVMKSLTKFEPTDRHPGQAETYSDDVVIGRYELTSFSGGCPAETKNAMLERVTNIRMAIALALETANANTEVSKGDIATALFDFALEPLQKEHTAKPQVAPAAA